jgi:hypothetical protein
MNSHKDLCGSTEYRIVYSVNLLTDLTLRRNKMDLSFLRVESSRWHSPPVINIASQRIIIGLLSGFIITGCGVQPRLPDGGAFCPWGNPIGNVRDFNYRVHTIVTVDLVPSSSGREILAFVTMKAEHAGTTVPRIINNWNGIIVHTLPPDRPGRISAISPSSGTAEGTTPRADFEIAACNDGDIHTGPGPFITVSGVIDQIQIIGDTGGDDISSNPNCSCDTQIRSLKLKRVNLTIED